MDKKSIVDNFKNELNNLSDEIKKLEGKLNEFGDEAKVTYKKQLDEMQELYKKAEVKFEEAKDVAEDRWEDVKENIDLTRKALKNSYNYFLSHYRKKE